MVPEVGTPTFRNNKPAFAIGKLTVKCSSSHVPRLSPLRARLTFDCKRILLVQSRVKRASKWDSLGTSLAEPRLLREGVAPRGYIPGNKASAVVQCCCLTLVSDYPRSKLL